MDVSTEQLNENTEEWRDPYDWSDEEIHQLVMRELGEDTIKPRGFQVLIKLWMPPLQYDSGIYRTDHIQRNERITTTIGKVLRMGSEAFRDARRFPGGPTVTFDEWGIFRSSERQLVQCGEHYLAFLNDDRFVGVTTNPSQLRTTFDLEYEHVG